MRCSWRDDMAWNRMMFEIKDMFSMRHCGTFLVWMMMEDHTQFSSHSRPPSILLKSQGILHADVRATKNFLKLDHLRQPPPPSQVSPCCLRNAACCLTKSKVTRINLTSNPINGSRMAMALPLVSPLKRKSLAGLALGANNRSEH